MNSSRYLLFILLFPAFSPAFTQEKGIINDPDRYVNLREGPGTNHEVVDEIWEGQSFTFFRSEESTWWKVETTRGKVGYLHSSKIQPYDLPNTTSCQCRYPYGESDDQPTLIAKVNGYEFIVCGYLLQRSSLASIKISESSIVRCADDSMLIFYSATETYSMTAKEDTLEIIELVRIPTGNDFSWELVPFLKSGIYPSDSLPDLTTSSVVLNLDHISAQQISELEEQLRSGWRPEKFSEIEDFMGKVAIGYMKGSNLCRDIFNDIEATLGFTLDGALGQLYYELTEIVQLYNES